MHNEMEYKNVKSEFDALHSFQYTVGNVKDEKNNKRKVIKPWVKRKQKQTAQGIRQITAFPLSYLCRQWKGLFSRS